MAILFVAYEVLANSGLFDAEYYIGANLDVAALNVDPLLHYLEIGAIGSRNPSGAFDARHYAELCRERGELCENPVLHYIEIGAAQGLSPRPHGKSVVPIVAAKRAGPQPVKPEAGELLLGLDRVHIESGHGATLKRSERVDLDALRAAAANSNSAVAARGTDRTSLEQPPMQLNIDSADVDEYGILHIVGWAVCLAQIAAVQVFIDGVRLCAAEHGRPREDVGKSRALPECAAFWFCAACRCQLVRQRRAIDQGSGRRLHRHFARNDRAIHVY